MVASVTRSAQMLYYFKPNCLMILVSAIDFTHLSGNLPDLSSCGFISWLKTFTGLEQEMSFLFIRTYTHKASLLRYASLDSNLKFYFLFFTFHFYYSGSMPNHSGVKNIGKQVRLYSILIHIFFILHNFIDCGFIISLRLC